MIEAVVKRPEKEPVDATTPCCTCSESTFAMPLVVTVPALSVEPVRETNVPVDN